jgi:hypothetical protein
MAAYRFPEISLPEGALLLKDGLADNHADFLDISATGRL